MSHLCAVIATTLLAGSAFADTINVPADYPTIQAAVDVAAKLPFRPRQPPISGPAEAHS